jgi:hypothetical protein
MATFPSKVNYATGDILTATNMNDVGNAINLLNGAQNSAGKNVVLNSNFSVWQRGTSGTANSFSAGAGYNADRWQNYSNVNALTISRQATGDTTNLPFIQYCARVQRNSGQTSTNAVTMGQSIESVNSINYAGKSITFTFYARAGANFSSASNALTATLYSGTGTDGNILTGFTGSAAVANGTATLTTTWQRFTFTGTVASTATQLGIYLAYTPVGTAGTNDYYEITGVQVEQANSASPYAPNGATYQAELAACQRYYYRSNSGLYSTQGFGTAYSTTLAAITTTFPVTMRTLASAIDFSTLILGDAANAGISVLAVTYSSAESTPNIAKMNVSVASGLTQFRPYLLLGNNSTASFLAFNAEL